MVARPSIDDEKILFQIVEIVASLDCDQQLDLKSSVVFWWKKNKKKGGY